VTIAIRPCVGWDRRVIDLIWVKRERKYFCKQDWTASIRLIRFNKSSCVVIARSASDEAIHFSLCGQAGLLRGACHRARIRATRWLAMTVGGAAGRVTQPKAQPAFLSLKHGHRGNRRQKRSRCSSGARACVASVQPGDKRRHDFRKVPAERFHLLSSIAPARLVRNHHPFVRTLADQDIRSATRRDF
jgi:hypothetical protein